MYQEHFAQERIKNKKRRFENKNKLSSNVEALIKKRKKCFKAERKKKIIKEIRIS